MISTNTSLQLIRKDIEHKATIGWIKGDLNTLLSQTARLHPQELMQLKAYQYERRQHSYLLGRLSAKTALKTYSERAVENAVWIDNGVFFFPVVKHFNPSNIQVSISHCNQIGISVAFPEAHPIGIDVERVNEQRRATILTQVTASERVLLTQNGLNTMNGITCIWSLKEALSKVLRTGMMLDFKYLEVNELQENNRIFEFRFSHFGQYKAFAFVISNYAYSLVLPARTECNVQDLYNDIQAIN